jgi:hypothetical protein
MRLSKWIKLWLIISYPTSLNREEKALMEEIYGREYGYNEMVNIPLIIASPGIAYPAEYKQPALSDIRRWLTAFGGYRKWIWACIEATSLFG